MRKHFVVTLILLINDNKAREQFFCQKSANDSNDKLMGLYVTKISFEYYRKYKKKIIETQCKEMPEQINQNYFSFSLWQLLNLKNCFLCSNRHTLEFVRKM